MTDEEIIASIKKLVISGKRVGEVCSESGVSRRIIQNVLHDKAPLSFIVRLRLEAYCKKNFDLERVAK